MSFSVIILAAGKGTRMKSALPKVLHPIAGKPMVQHIIDNVTGLGADHIHLIYGHGGDALKQNLTGDNLNWCEQAQQLGTGHAAQQAAPHIRDNEDVLILVGDAPLIQPQTLNALKSAKQSADLALLTVHLDDPSGMGRIIREGNNITAIVEHKDATEAQRQISEINTGIMMMNGADLKRWLDNLSNDNAQGEYYLTDVIAMAAAEGKSIQAAHPETPVEVEGVNNRVQLARLERAYQARQAEALMIQGVSLADPARFDLRGSLTTGEDVSIDVNVVIQGNVSLGNQVRIGPNCVLTDCRIEDGTVIEANSIIEQAHVGPECQVGPFARLRPDAELKHKAKVGNFVEVKKAVLGEGAKVNHLTYIGDADIGAGVNVGAGTITCNYDGANKFRTVIKDGAFIGSNTSLVAPVTVGQNATIGAGSTVTKDVEDEQLAVARGKQRNIQGWERPKKQ